VRDRLGRAALLAVLLVVAYHRAAATLWRVWMTNDNYSHGPLVPLVSLVLAWRLRGALRAQPARTDARGLVLVTAAAALLVLGQRADVFLLQGYSMVAMAVGLVWTFAGPAWLRALAFPLGFLICMLPFPPVFVNNLSYALKDATVRLSAAAASALGVNMQREGMTVYLAAGELRIENPCSGLRSLVSLLATGAIFAYLQEGAAWRKAVVFAAAIPLAMLGNAVRITGLILVADYAGLPAATGVYHDVSGFAVYAAAVLGLFLLRRGLEPAPAAAREAR
jgi:exosortase